MSSSDPSRHKLRPDTDTDLFSSGNFSAKYATAGKRTPSPSSSHSSVQTGDVRSSRPVTITGGFAEPHSMSSGPSMSVHSNAHIATMIQSRDIAPRRNSALSSALSSSVRMTPSSPAVAESEVVSTTSQSAVHAIEQHLPGSVDDSLKLQGGDTTRGIYNWVNSKQTTPLRRTLSTGSTVSKQPTDDDMSVQDILTPGGFRRNYIASKRGAKGANAGFLKRNFFDLLTVYDHFAGEDLSEEETEESTTSEDDEETDEEEDNELYREDLTPRGSSPTRPGAPSSVTFARGRRSFQSFSSHQQPSPVPRRAVKKRHRRGKKKTSTGKSFLLLLKAFIGTGVVFLPKSFSNGGLSFCNLMIVAFSIVSYYCFVVLVRTTSYVGVSGYGDVGKRLFGHRFQQIILLSLVMSQMGFSSSYVVFVAENFKHVADAIFGETYGVALYIFLQPLLFIPLSLTRRIGKLGIAALVADFFILLGLIYIYLQTSLHLVGNGPSPVKLFKHDTWPLFIGTAVFAYEGIGLLIPIQESMAQPELFDRLLLVVIVITTVVFTTLPSLAYLAYGETVKTVILMNFPENAASLIVQLLYAIAILLSTPLQLFPAIKIVENYLFSKSRKPWKKKIRRNSQARSNSFMEEYGATDFTDISPSKSPSYNENLVNDEGQVSGKSDWKIKWLKNLLRVSLVLLMCLIAYGGSNNLDHFVSLIGSFTCVPLIYVYPPLLYMKCFQDTLGGPEKAACMLIALVGFCLLLYTSYETLSTW